jgi:23S rRNA (guanosine2251-2'-O)-methyltransferase
MNAFDVGDSTHVYITLATSATRFPLLLVLDNLRSAFNVGSIFRTADACGVCLVITTGITPHPHGNGADKVSKAALGADTVVPSLHFTTTKQGLEYLRQFYPQVAHVALETTSRSRPYTDISYPGGVNSSNTLVHHFNSQNFLREEEKQVFCEPGTALILGNEVSGVDTELLESMDFIVEIPMYGVKNSLNVASCAPVVLYEILRQWDI